MAESGRVVELRRRLEREPGSRLFAQLAEELRKDGDLQEAVSVSRAGLEVHPAYTSARLTLGRALEDLGRLEEARGEYEAILRVAPDNLAAGRQLAECLAGLGQPALALERCERTLSLAPGDRVLEGRIAELKRQLGRDTDRVSEPGVGKGMPPPLPASSVGAAESEEAPTAEDAPQEPPLSADARVGGDSMAPSAADTPESSSGPVALASPTLAELYFSQGSLERAVEVYRQVVADEPENAKAKARLFELEQLSIGGRAVTERASNSTPEDRRAAIERVIGRLDQLLKATRRS